jgi:hypothetical protein
MNDAVEALIRRLERSLSLTYDAAGSCEWPCRAGELFRVRLGDQLFALKLYEQGYFNDAYLFRALATTPVPIPLVHAYDDSRDLVGKPWILMDWLQGDQKISDLRAVGQQVGRMLREIHAISVAGQRDAVRFLLDGGLRYRAPARSSRYRVRPSCILPSPRVTPSY